MMAALQGLVTSVVHSGQFERLYVARGEDGGELLPRTGKVLPSTLRTVKKQVSFIICKTYITKAIWEISPPSVPHH